MRPSDVGPIQNEKGADAVVRIAPTHQESAGGFPRLLAVRTKIDGISSSLDHRDPGDGLFPSLEPIQQTGIISLGISSASANYNIAENRFHSVNSGRREIE